MKYLRNSLGKVQIGEDMAIGNQMNTMLPLREVARLLSIHPNTLRRWADKGIIRAYRITSRGDRRFMREDVRHFLTEMNTQNQQ